MVKAMSQDKPLSERLRKSFDQVVDTETATQILNCIMPVIAALEAERDEARQRSDMLKKYLEDSAKRNIKYHEFPEKICAVIGIPLPSKAGEGYLASIQEAVEKAFKAERDQAEITRLKQQLDAERKKCEALREARRK